MTCPTCNDTGYVAVVAKDETGPVLDAPCTCMMGRVQRLREQVNTLTLQRDGLAIENKRLRAERDALGVTQARWRLAMEEAKKETERLRRGGRS